MPDLDTLKSRGYEQIHRSKRFEIWQHSEKGRIYVNIFDSPSRQEVDEAFVTIAGSFTRPVDLITDHRNMTPIGAAQTRELSVCFDSFFEQLQIRYMVRVCATEESSQVCVPLDTRLSREKISRVLSSKLGITDGTRLNRHHESAATAGLPLS